MTQFTINRRHFIKGAAATFALTALGAQGMDFFPSQKIWRVGLIGTGWYGKSDLFKLIQVAPVEVVALCDVDRNQLTEAGALVSKRQKSGKIPRLYNDYQKMLTENPMDIVLIGTPDHWHALQTIDAIKAGANVYVQKPISVDVMEGEAMVAAARKYKRTVQVGLQRRSTPHLLDAKKNIVEAGLLGKISHVEMCCYYHMRNNSNPPVQPVPVFLDYNLWSGPAPLLPYVGLPHRGGWRAMMEYGNGIVGDMCVHMLDAVRWTLNLGWPTRISSSGGIYVQKDARSNISDTQSALFEFDGLTAVWQHRSWGAPTDPEYPWAYKIFGDKGTLACSVMKYDFTPLDGGKGIHKDALYEREKYPEDLQEKDIELHTAAATRAQMLNFIACIQNGNKPVADIEEGHISTASCILANLAMKTGRTLVYDSKSRNVLNDAEATKLLSRTYRQSWIHPTPEKI
ncbi:MAG: Gfo/Idh/MocA family oxidoreductase [Cyclobacteriaceae bacterium]|nr:Gfo/Idh/MocA family oxidoreductase [Cyclobacteriaceae bacterium]